MFVSYEVLGLHADGYKDDTYVCELIDTEFSVQFIAERFHSGLDVITPFIEIYESREKPLAPNLATYCVFASKKYKVPADTFITQLAKVNSKFAKYTKDIERYLILI